MKHTNDCEQGAGVLCGQLQCDVFYSYAGMREWGFNPNAWEGNKVINEAFYNEQCRHP